jgi:hypothetical protein
LWLSRFDAAPGSSDYRSEVDLIAVDDRVSLIHNVKEFLMITITAATGR